VNVVTNFGARKIRLEYMQEQTVTIGPETIKIKSFNFEYKTKSVEIAVSTEPKAPKAEALIVEYSNVSLHVPQLKLHRDAKTHDGAKVRIVGVFTIQDGKTPGAKGKHPMMDTIAELPPVAGKSVGDTQFDISLDRKKFPRIDEMKGKKVVVTGTIRYFPKSPTNDKAGRPRLPTLTLESIAICK